MQTIIDKKEDHEVQSGFLLNFYKNLTPTLNRQSHTVCVNAHTHISNKTPLA